METNNNKPVKAGNQKWGNLLYIIIPVLLIISLAYFTGEGNKTEKPKYYQVVQLFREDKVDEFSLNLSSGALRYSLTDSEEYVNYTVPNVDIFLKDVHNYVTEHNLSSQTPIKYDYIRGSNGSWWASMLPMTILSIMLVAVMLYFYRKMGQNIMTENNRTLSFGKARVKLGKDEKRKTTFKDVAGADEEKAELEEIVEFLRAELTK